MRVIGRVVGVTMTLSLVIAVAGVLEAGAEAPDWNALSATETVEVLTQDEDGSPRMTTVWLLVQDGEAYLRTGQTRWGGNVVRSGELTLRVGESEYALGVEFEEDDARRERVKQGFRDKYGWTDGLIGWFRGARPRHMRLVSK